MKTARQKFLCLLRNGKCMIWFEQYIWKSVNGTLHLLKLYFIFK